MEERQYTEAELIAELEDPHKERRKCGVPHPLSHFTLPTFVDGESIYGENLTNRDSGLG